MPQDNSPHSAGAQRPIGTPELGEVVLFPVPEPEQPTDPFDRQSILGGLVDGYFTDPERDLIVDAVLQHRLDALKSPIPRFITRDQLVNWLESDDGPDQFSLWFNLVKSPDSGHEQLSISPWLEENRATLRDEYDDGIKQRERKYTNVSKIMELAFLSRDAHPLTQEWRDNGQISKPIREDDGTFRVDVNDPAAVMAGFMDFRVPGKRRLPPGQARSILLMSWLQHHEREVSFTDTVFVEALGATALADPETFHDEIYFDEVVSRPFIERPLPARPDEMLMIRGLTPNQQKILKGMLGMATKGIWFSKSRLENSIELSKSSLLRITNKLVQSGIFQKGEHGYRFLVEPEQVACTEIIELDAPKSPDTPEQGVLLDLSDIRGPGELEIARKVIDQALAMDKEWFSRGDFTLITDKISDERTLNSVFSVVAKKFIRSGLFAYRGELTLRKYMLTARPTAIEVDVEALLGPFPDDEQQRFEIDTSEFDVPEVVDTPPKPPKAPRVRQATPPPEPVTLPPPAPPMPAVGTDQILAQLEPDKIETLSDNAYDLIAHWTDRDSIEATAVALAGGLRGGRQRGITIGDTKVILDELIEAELVVYDSGKYRIKVPENVSTD